VQFVISVQHDCRKGDCQPTIVRKEFQEREETNRNISFLLHHSDDDHFIVNISALHNSVKLRRALPRSFTELKPLFVDRLAFHKMAAEKARDLEQKDATRQPKNGGQMQRQRSRKPNWRQRQQQRPRQQRRQLWQQQRQQK
ncbi:hypothetical protein B0H14DRAFT_2358757, partial [Mycena olivaceomarginata]